MASAAEQLASNMSFGAFTKSTELRKRIIFTILALVVYRFGAQLTIPGVNASQLQDIFSDSSLLGMMNTFTGQALGQMTIFALGVFPYITSSIVMQLMTSISKQMEALKKEGEAGRRKINQYTRYLTVFLTLIQGSGIAFYIQSQGASFISGPMLYFTVLVTLLGGTLFLMWLGEQITQRGIGNGISLIIYVGIITGLPSAIVQLFDKVNENQLSALGLIAILIALIVIFAFIVFIERAQRRVIINYPRQAHAQRFQQQQASHIPLKLNTAGVIPPIFAGSLLSFPQLISQFATTENAPAFLQKLQVWLGTGRPLYYILSAALVIFFTFFYTSIVFNPEETAQNLKRNGGFIPGVRPGKSTEKYFDYVLTRLATFAAAYLTFLTLLPTWAQGKLGIGFALGGTSLLIMVSVTMDTVTQVQSHMLAQQYEGLMKRAKISKRGGRR